ncbi:MAG: acetyl-CoA carboxylase carboxyltransferase subunit beta [Candidatus Hydrogenedentota bacterium]|nr:MAG: acetyl-CoA carboxylase carboxyltransferase subunit beta [Candidatus Hydrogenedentota bacterium]
MTNWFKRVKSRVRRIPEDEALTGLWTKCTGCETMLPKSELKENLFVCPQCNYHHRIDARSRLKHLLDEGSFEEFDARMVSEDPLEFVDQKPYALRVDEARSKTGEKEAVITGRGTIEEIPVGIAVMNFAFMGGSMGSVVGEKVTRVVERATEEEWPVLFVTASGGARMQEGILSLMQMAKTVAAVRRHRERGLVSISLLTDPTTGGTTASFATVTDFVLAEPGALIAFAGPRVIEQTIRQKLPEGFQQSEFLLEHGMVDRIVDRNEQRAVIRRLIEFATLS